MKRALDVFLSTLGLVLAAPLILGCAIAIRSTSPGKAILRQSRVGRDEALFVCLKLRTMYDDMKHVPTHQADRSAITPLGMHLRRLKLDELPQLWNVLKGEMSLVGPRPCLPSQTELIEQRRGYGLHAVRPGITGVAQVAGVDMSDPTRLAALDATYLDDMTLRRDLAIICATILGSGRGDRVRALAQREPPSNSVD